MRALQVLARRFALKTPIPVQFDAVFSAGLYFVDVNAINNYEKVQSGAGDPQERDPETGERMWAVRVLDPDPEARAGTMELKVKIAAPVQPVGPEKVPGSPFTPVEFDGMAVTPWIDTNGLRPKLMYSLRAKAMRSPSAPPATKPERSGGAS